MEINKIYHGNSLNILKNFPDASIDMCVTSPPYYGLRSYGTESEIWGGKEDCDHEWGLEINKNFNKPHHGESSKHISIQKELNKTNTESWGSVFCSKCGCYDEETEVLTRKGWILFKDLTYNDYVATIINDEMKYVKPDDIMEYDYEGEMVSFTGQNIDLLVTPNHNMYAKKREYIYKNQKSIKEYEFIQASDIKTGYKIKRHFHWGGDNIEFFNLPIIKDRRNRTKNNSRIFIDIKIWMKFLGIYLAEGWCSKRERDNNNIQYAVYITQTKDFGKEYIENLLKSMPFKWSYTRDKNYVIYNKSLYNYLSKMGNVYNKYIPEDIKNLSKSDLICLLEGFRIGDGHLRKDGREEIYTTSYNLMNDLNEVILKCGYTTSIKQYKDKRRDFNRNICYRIPIIKNQKETSIRNINKVYYKGKVYCCEVNPSHLLIVRRKGKNAVCGNSWRGELGLEPSPDLYIEHLVEIFREVKRVLKKEGTLWINIGDTYATVSGSYGSKNPEHMGLHSRGGLTDTVNFKQNDLSKYGYKSKDLIGIPWKLAESLKSPYYKGKIKRESDRTWLASMIDGEGSICGLIHDRKDGGGRRSDIFITVTNSNKKILNKCNQIWPTSKIENMEFTLHHKSHWGDWIPYGMDNKMDLLQEIYPYMIGKRKQVLLAWNFFKLNKSSKKIWKKYPEKADDYRKKREKIINLLSELNTCTENNVIIPSWIEEPPSLYEDGWYLRQDIIWAKATSGDVRLGSAMPESVQDRCSKSHEYIFLFSKSYKYYFDHESIKEPSISQKNELGSRRSVWFIKLKPYKESHFATFPPNLIKPIITAGCPKNGIVLDPFIGSGTVGAVAKEKNLNYIGVEKNKKYIEIAEKRIEGVIVSLF